MACKSASWTWQSRCCISCRIRSHPLETHQRGNDFLSLLVDFEIEFCARLRVARLQILADHDQRHQQDLNDVADEEVGDEGRKWIEGLPMQDRDFRRQDV